MEKGKIKLFGVEISVSTNDEEVLYNNSTPPEYSSIPTAGDPSTHSLLDQEKRVHHDQNNVAVNLSATIQNPSSEVSRKSPSKKTASDEIHDPSSSPSTCDDGILDDDKVYSPTPLRCFPPTNIIFSASELGFSRKKPCQEKKKAKTNIKEDKSIIPPVLQLEEIPGLMERIGSQNGSTKPVFLYKKKLVESDVRAHLNRLFISGSEKELMGFLRKEEKAAVADKTKQGLEFVGMDKKGEIYNLRLANWSSLTMIVINREWMKMVKANNAQKGDWVELWGYRVNNEFRLVVNVRKSETRHIGDGSSSSSDTTNVGGMALILPPSP